ncbi:ABC transporter substrate-binding protein [Oribacterium sp. WCC10]|uniref:ABC transporter substrate-binding protein n=1 Tax=Oribacterium sp. WCC10 TaxID=1855343 RepID=UPI0008F1009D|nr:ABC transporter substrate-binding protein [Oribacterium sp. WCC10]SFG62501.1 branched-chain amino acid transport system substrate-binding protein [Oribacterium sp. WCC10]
MKSKTGKKLLSLLAITGLSVTLLGACASDVPPAANIDTKSATEDAAETTGTESSKVIKFGVIAPLTGAHAEYGQGFDAATQIAAEEINAAGGVNGYTIELECQDSAADAKTSSDIFTRYGEDDSIMAVIGDFTSSCCKANAPLADEYGLVQISPTASDPSYASMNDYCYTVMYNQSTAAPWTAESVVGHYLGKTACAVMYLNTDWGITTNDYLLQGIDKAGIKLLGDESYSENETDFSSVIEKLKATGADCLVILDQGNVPTIINQVRAADWDCQIVSLGPGASDQILELCGENANGLVIPCPSYITEDNPTTSDFYKKFFEKNKCAPTDHALCAYTCVQVLAKALESIDGEITREKIKDALKDVQYDGMAGHTQFNEDGGVNRDLLIIQVVDGTYVIQKEYGYK